jgi:hypothetical protein
VPEVNEHRDVGSSVLHFFAFALGLALLFALREILGQGISAEVPPHDGRARG